MARTTFRRKLALVLMSVVVLTTIYFKHNVLLASSKGNEAVYKRATPIPYLTRPEGVDEPHLKEHSVNKVSINITKKPTVRFVPCGVVNYDQWKCSPFIGYFVDDLRLHRHDWPENPTTRMSSESVHVVTDNVLHFGARMYGYLYPPVTGLYWFSINSSSTTAAFSIELWISSSYDASKLGKVHNVTCTNEERKLNSCCYNISSPVHIELHGSNIYYFEFHVKSFKGSVNIEVLWRIPNTTHLQIISSSYLSMAFNYSSPESSYSFQNLPSNGIQRVGYLKPAISNVSKIIALDVLPKCVFTPSYVKAEPVEHYKGYYKVRESGIYPWDLNEYVYIDKARPGNRRITKAAVDFVHSLYMKEFNKVYTSHTVTGVHYLEETVDQSFGSRYLLEMDIQLENGDTIQTSEYIYLPKKKQGKLCHTSNFQWKRNVNVYIVVSVKNLGPWIKHLIYNMEDIYHVYNDKHFQLVIVDYNSEDINITEELLKSSLPHWKVVALDGPFSRSAGLQAGIDYATDNNSIVMTIDMHLTLPLDFVENIRKHTIQGKMAYAPMFFKLSEGYTENNVNGYWQVGTYGLFGMYKSDWEKVGGFDVLNYKYKWGGEDWDLLDRTVSQGIEVFRVRPPGLFHYYHTRAGMWGIRGNEDGC